jgi:hypothetical protein
MMTIDASGFPALRDNTSNSPEWKGSTCHDLALQLVSGGLPASGARSRRCRRDPGKLGCNLPRGLAHLFNVRL